MFLLTQILRTPIGTQQQLCQIAVQMAYAVTRLTVVWGSRIYFDFLLVKLEIIIIQYMIKIKRATLPFRLL